MKLKRDDVLGSFDGCMSNIKLGKNIDNGMLIYTRFHENAHKIFQSSYEIGVANYFLKKDCEIAAENRDFKYCNRITVVVNALEMFTENINEIFANTCELLAVNENGIDVNDYVDKCKKGVYKKYCFLFDYMNCIEGNFYDKFGILLSASSKTMQRYDISFVRIGLEEGIAKLRELLSSCEAPEILLQKILYNEISYEKKELNLNTILDVLEELGTLKYIKDFVSIVRTTGFEKAVEKMLEHKELMNLRFHMGETYFLWDDIKCRDVLFEDFVLRKADFLAIDGSQAEECVAYKYSGDDEIVKCYLDVGQINLLLDTVKYVMYEKEKNAIIDKALRLQNNLVLIRFYGKVEDYFKEVVTLNNKAKFVTVSESEDYAVSFGALIPKMTNREIYFSPFNGVFSKILYKAVERLGGETFCSEDMLNCFATEELMFAYCHAILFCLKATT